MVKPIFTPEQLEEYYLVYKNSDVRYLRTLLLHTSAERPEGRRFALLKNGFKVLPQ